MSATVTIKATPAQFDTIRQVLEWARDEANQELEHISALGHEEKRTKSVEEQATCLRLGRIAQACEAMLEDPLS